MADVKPPGWIKLEVSVGTILQAVLMAVGLIVWGVHSAGTAEQAGKELDAFRGEVRVQFSEIRAQIQNLPTQQERVAQLERQRAEDVARMLALDVRLTAMEKAAIQSQATLDMFMRGSALPPQKLR